MEGIAPACEDTEAFIRVGTVTIDLREGGRSVGAAVLQRQPGADLFHFAGVKGVSGTGIWEGCSFTEKRLGPEAFAELKALLLERAKAIADNAEDLQY